MLQPGHDPAAEAGGVATTALQRAFGLETFWLGSATSESLRDSDDDGATTEVGLATSVPNEARRRAQRE